MNRRSFIKRTVAALVAVSFLPLRSVFGITKKPKHCLDCTLNYSDKCKGCPSSCSICPRCGGPLVPRYRLYSYIKEDHNQPMFPISDAMYCKLCNYMYSFPACKHRRQDFSEREDTTPYNVLHIDVDD